MRLQPGRLARHQRVVRAVRLVEAVVGEILDVAPDGFGRLGRNSAHPLRAGHEARAMFLQLLFLFLADRPSDQIGVAGRIAGQVGHDLNDLLLIDQGPVRVSHDRLKRRVPVADRLLPVLARDE